MRAGCCMTVGDAMRIFALQSPNRQSGGGHPRECASSRSPWIWLWASDDRRACVPSSRRWLVGAAGVVAVFPAPLASPAWRSDRWRSCTAEFDVIWSALGARLVGGSAVHLRGTANAWWSDDVRWLVQGTSGHSGHDGRVAAAAIGPSHAGVAALRTGCRLASGQWYLDSYRWIGPLGVFRIDGCRGGDAVLRTMPSLREAVLPARRVRGHSQHLRESVHALLVPRRGRGRG